MFQSSDLVYKALPIELFSWDCAFNKCSNLPWMQQNRMMKIGNFDSIIFFALIETLSTVVFQSSSLKKTSHLPFLIVKFS